MGQRDHMMEGKGKEVMWLLCVYVCRSRNRSSSSSSSI